MSSQKSLPHLRYYLLQDKIKIEGVRAPPRDVIPQQLLQHASPQQHAGARIPSVSFDFCRPNYPISDQKYPLNVIVLVDTERHHKAVALRKRPEHDERTATAIRSAKEAKTAATYGKLK